MPPQPPRQKPPTPHEGQVRIPPTSTRPLPSLFPCQPGCSGTPRVLSEEQAKGAVRLWVEPITQDFHPKCLTSGSQRICGGLSPGGLYASSGRRCLTEAACQLAFSITQLSLISPWTPSLVIPYQHRLPQRLAASLTRASWAASDKTKQGQRG